MARSEYRFSTANRVRMAEMDPLGHVFNARYLDYLNVVLPEYLRTVTGAAAGLPLLFVRSTLDYRAPCFFDEVLDLCLRCDRIGRSSVTVAWAVHGAGRDDERCVGESTLVHARAGKAVPLPEAWVAAVEGYEGRRLRA